MSKVYPGSLHGHTDYSNIRLRDCVIKIEDAFKYAEELGHKVIAFTDHETVSSWVKVEEVAKNYPNIKALRGNEIYLVRNGLNTSNFVRDVDRYYHFILIAKDLVGAKQIYEISTRAWLRSSMSRGMRRVPTYYQDLVDIIGDNPGHVIGSTACFREGTMIETKEGWKPIEYIQKGDYVLNRYGEWEEVIEPTCNWYNGWMYNIDFSGNEKPIICTENHQFLTITGNSKVPKWVQAKDLIVNRGNTKHICLRPFNKNYPFKDNFIINKEEFLHSYFKDSAYSHKSYTLPDQTIITPELMRLFGLFLGDGCLSLKENPRLSFTLNIKEFEAYYQSFIREAGKQLGIVWNINRREKNNRVDITSSCVELIDLFYWLFGDVKANNKYIPERLKINDELSYELIFGYLLADGYFRIRKATETIKYSTGEFVTASISKRLSYDFYELLNQIGITTNISYSKGGYRNNCNHQDSWYLEGSNKFIGNLCKTKLYTHNDIVKYFDDAVQYKKKDFCIIDNIHYRKMRIKNKSMQLSHEYVYCLNNTTHSFKCENVIVHNCLGGALPTQILRGTPDAKLQAWIEQMKSIFGPENFFLEMQPSKNKEQIIVNKKLLEFSQQLDVPYIITTDSHYLKKEDREVHKAYLKAQSGEREVDDFYATTYMMGTEELESFFPYLTKEDVQKAYSTIEQIADACETYSIKKPLRIPSLIWRESLEKTYSPDELEPFFEKMPTLREFYTSSYKSDQYLVRAVIEGINNHESLQNEKAYDALEDTLQRTWESSEVNKVRWSAYFLNLQRNIDECWNAGTIVGPGRGSGGGFLLLYCLDIIQINALEETTETYPWRFLNPKRESVLDIDTDIEGGRRAQVLQHLRKVYGEDRVANVATFRTEKTKSAILTATRGLGYDVDIGQYLASLVPADRGTLRTLDQCMYGDKENGWAPVRQFVVEMEENYPDIWKVARGIEGLICGSGVHAGGVIFVDEPFTESSALMRAPDGTICTAFELSDCEEVSLIKVDILSVEALDKIHICIDLLCEYGFVEKKPTLRETYESVVGIYNLEREAPEMWDMVFNHEIGSLFQMEKQSGINGIALIRPRTVHELAVLNSVIRLMASERGAEQPLEMWARYRRDINEWLREMEAYGLSSAQIEWLKNHKAITDGICESQEGLMSLLQEEELGGNDLSFADKCRKAIAKKQGALFEECENAYFQNAKEKKCDMRLVHYVWDVLLKVQRGYSFCRAHTLAYSLVALQEMNLCHRYPIIFWDAACLISDAGGSEVEEDAEEDEEEIVENYSSDFEDFGVEEEDEEEEEEEESSEKKKPKKKTKSVNYGKIASAIGKIKSTGVTIAPPDINLSTYTFSPDLENNQIRYGLLGITRVGEELVKTILANRPYASINDFLNRIKVNRLQMINLIKSGAFDGFGPRETIMREYIEKISNCKKRITLQNMRMLIEFGLIPEKYDLQRRVYNFNKYLKKMKMGEYYGVDNIAFSFFSERLDVDLLVAGDTESGFKIKATTWEKIYQSHMDIVRPYVKSNNAELLEAVNTRLIGDTWNKYCLGSFSKWEMDSISCYIHEHELAHINLEKYGLVDFSSLSETPEIEKYLMIKGKRIPIYKLHRILGTVLDRDKSKKTVTLLTKDAVVVVKIYGVFQQYDKQISEKGADGRKHIVRKSEFTRGNKIIVTGIREGDGFRAKKYSKTPWHIVETIGAIDNEEIIIDNRND